MHSRSSYSGIDGAIGGILFFISAVAFIFILFLPFLLIVGAATFGILWYMDSRERKKKVIMNRYSSTADWTVLP